MPRVSERGVEIGSLASLEPVLKKWQKLIEKMAQEWLSVKDVPWWYNERASLSLFAGAVWSCHGWVFEEFGIWRKIASKRGVKYTSGRRDIEFRVGDDWFSAEAKQCWPILSGNAEDPLIAVGKYLNQAVREAKQLTQKGCQSLGIVFAIPRVHVSQKDQIDQNLWDFVSQLRKAKRATVAWTFPREARGIQPSKDSENHNYTYPGIVVLILPARRC
jgi:hypothetical protein